MANENATLTGPGRTPDSKLPPIGDGPRRKMIVTIEVSADFERRLDNQWMVEREIHADRWSWEWADSAAAYDLLAACKSVLAEANLSLSEDDEQSYAEISQRSLKEVAAAIAKHSGR